MSRKLVWSLMIIAIPASAAMGQGVTLFSNLAAFEAAAGDAGKIIKGIEDFQESNVGPGALGGPLLDPIQGGVPNLDPFGLGFPNGLAFDNLMLQSNLLGVGATTPAPGGGLVVLGAGFIGQPTTVVGANVFAESTDMMFPDGDKTAIGFDLFTNFGPGVQVTVFDIGGGQIFQDVVNSSTSGAFVGLLSNVPIGRINVADVTAGGELVDNIRMYVPEPATLALLVLGAAAVIRRRR